MSWAQRAAHNIIPLSIKKSNLRPHFMNRAT